MPTEPVEVPAPSRQFLAGDALRALAALSVVVYHFAYGAARQSGHSGFVDAYGAKAGRAFGGLELGLYIFFVLSGYLIAGPWVRAYVDGTPMPSARRYARNRVLRLVPAFWVVFTVLLLVDGRYGAGFGDLAAIYLFAQNYAPRSVVQGLIGPAWTLSVELAFYALVPIVALLVIKLRAVRGSAVGRARTVLLGAALVWLASIAVKVTAPADLAWQRAAPMMLFAFMPGVALAAVEAGRASSRRTRGSRVSPHQQALLLLAAGTALLVLYAATAHAGIPPLTGVAPPVLASLGCLGVVAAPMVLQWNGVRTPAPLRWPPVLWLGERSYGIYLLHQGVLATIIRWSGLSHSAWPRLLTTLAIGVPATLVAAAVLFALVERPFMRRRLPWRRPTGDEHVTSHPTLPSG